ncbi:MAG TPA: enoyl-CoA hydratase-related protein, partial [Mycobacteriales bacterium]|nr:enoyl-CoA hydratase-related protein [Mycobacteriales bacterium]
MTQAVNEALGEAADAFRVTRGDAVATITIDRPGKQNAISYAMWLALGRLMPVLAADDEVAVVVLRGVEGGPFSAGADIAEFTTLRLDATGARRYGEAVASGEQALVAFPKPTIALVQGYCIGGGTQLALACDLRVCDASARFGITPAKLGIVYALPSTARLVETVGPAWARWILFTADLLDAPTALRIGLVHETVAEDVVARAYDLATTIASRARISLTGSKVLVERAAQGERVEDDAVRALYEESYRSVEYAEGVAAFLDKRAADFAAARH